MPQLLIPDIDETLLERLRSRAAAHARSAEAEVKQILTEALQAPSDPWAAVNAFRERLAASGRDFGDSTQDIREDRDR